MNLLKVILTLMMDDRKAGYIYFFLFKAKQIISSGFMTPIYSREGEIFPTLKRETIVYITTNKSFDGCYNSIYVYGKEYITRSLSLPLL